MPREFHRSRRVEEQLQRLLAELIRREVRDPRVGPITITQVAVSRDLKHAKVYFVPFDPARVPAEVATALASASGFLRMQLRHSLDMRQVPELVFVPDDTIDRAAHLSALISAAVRSDAERAAAAPAEEGAAEPADPAEPNEAADPPEEPPR